MKRVTSSDNYSDALTKVVGRQLHYRHNDYLLGKHQPKFVSRDIQGQITFLVGSLMDSVPTLCSDEHGGGDTQTQKGDPAWYP